MKSSTAVYLFVFQRHWKGQAIFAAIMALMILYIGAVWPEFQKSLENPLGSSDEFEVKITLEETENDTFLLTWDPAILVDGYAILVADTAFDPITYVQLNISQIADSLPSRSHDPLVEVAPAGDTNRTYPALLAEWGTGSTVHFAVFPFRGETNNSTVIAFSGVINTRDLTAVSAFDAFLDNPAYAALGDTENLLTLPGFFELEFFAATFVLAMIFPLLVYTGSFSGEQEKKTIDLLLAAPVTRTQLFTARFLGHATISFAITTIWALVAIASIRGIGGLEELPAGNILAAFFLCWVFFLLVQGLAMLASAAVNETRSANGITFGVYFGMYILIIIARLNESLAGLKWISVMHYLATGPVLFGDAFPWLELIVMGIAAVVLFVVGMKVYERRDIAS